MKHLYSNQCHDESEAWCDDPDYFRNGTIEPTNDPDKADCIRCLVAAETFGARAGVRLRQLHPKDSNMCAFDGHHYDCTCGVMPG